MNNTTRFRNGSEKVTIKQAISYTIRALKLVRKTQPITLEVDSLLNAVNALTPMIVLFFSARIISELVGERNTSAIILYAALTVGTAFLFRIINAVASHITKAKGIHLFWHRYNRFEGVKYAEMDYMYTDDAEVHQLREDINMKGGANGLGMQRVLSIPRLFGQVVGLIAAAILLSGMFTQSEGNSFINSPWVIISLLFATIAIPTLTHAFLNKRLNELMLTISANNVKASAARGYYQKTFINNYRSNKDVRIFNIKDSIMTTLEKSLAWYKGKWMNAGRMTNAISDAVAVLFSVLAFLIIGLRAINGMYDIGEVTRYVGAIAAFSASVVGIVNIISDLYQNAPYLAMLYDYIDLPSQKYLGSLTTEKRTDHNYELEFKNVSFKYPGTDNYVLKNINLKFNIGERMAVVGRNGSGKTTLIKLLCRLYDPTEGEITLNGIDVKKYILNDYIKIFSVIFQDFAILHLPLGENVATAHEYNKEAVTQALEKVGFGTRLAELEKGLQTPLYRGSDEEGISISGGEAQKIALARALYKDASFVILDEPTSALDPLAEYEIYTKFDQIVGDKTAIYISHRLSSCRFCDKIVVFKDGELIQQGSHDELVTDEKGDYYRLWTAQAQHYGDTVV